MKPIAVLGQPGTIRRPAGLTTEKIFEECGQNTGNMAFWYAVNKTVRHDKKYIGWHHPPKDINENCSALIMVAANWIGPHSDLHQLAAMLEGVKVPVVIIGLGAQAGLGAKKIAIQPGTEKFLRVVADKKIWVGARGPFTAEILHQSGILNVEVMGCPSNFINPNPNLGKVIEKKLENLHIRRVALNFDLGGSIVPCVKEYTKWLEQFGGMFICQNPLDPIRLACNDYDEKEDAELIEKTRQIVAPEKSTQEFIRFMSTYFRIYYDTESWMGDLKTCDLSIGSRLHGNILAFHSETPAVIIPHDSRTKELSETIKVPFVPLNEALKAQSPEAFLEKVQFDGEAYDANRRKLAKTYTLLLKTAGVQVNDHVSDLLRLQQPLLENAAP